MNDVTHILHQIEDGDAAAAEQLLPLVYEELRGLARARMASESPDHTLQATALVHEAYVRLVDVNRAQHWNSRGHFYSAAAEAMRRILIESFRRKQQQKRGGDHERVALSEADLGLPNQAEELLGIDEVLDQLQAVDERAAALVKLRCFGGFSVTDAGEVIGLSSSSAYEHWSFAKAWLRRALGRD